MWSIDPTHAPHVYSFAVAGLVLLTALVIYVIELRRVGGTPWSERYTDRVVPLYRAPARVTSVPLRTTAPDRRPQRSDRRPTAPRRIA